MFKIIEVNHSIANRFPTHIEINRHLKKYPELLKPILTHELAHTNKPTSLHDLKLDFLSDSKVNHWDLLKFMFKHPSSFVQLSPLIYSKRTGLVLDYNLIIMYLIMVSFLTLIVYLGVTYL